jgi:hypothetical protein
MASHEWTLFQLTVIENDVHEGDPSMATNII